jgi:thioredoxin-related protein
VRKLFLFVLVIWASMPALGGNLEWFTDAQQGLEKAKGENKLLVLDFTGSDWCGWCMKLKSEVFDKPEFAEFARTRLVLVEVDFPHQKGMAQAQKQANERLAQAYHITGFPTIVVLNQNGQQVGRTGYVAGGPGAFINQLERLAKSGNQVAQAPASREPEPVRKPVTFTPIAPAVPLRYGALALKGISGTKERRMVLINNTSMLSGETARVRVQDQEVVVCCKEIREDSVVITSDGKRMELTLAKR